MKIVTIVGTRPQFVKAAAVSRILRKQKRIRQVLLHTGQHFDYNMSAIFFDELQIPRPDYHLQIHTLPHGAMTGRMIEAIEKILTREKPDCVIVYGDTTSTLAGSIAAKKLQIKLAHIESGMRSRTLHSPEEVNRIVADRLSDLLFCSTGTAVENLEREGFRHFNCSIVQSGDVLYDAALYYSKRAKRVSHIMRSIPYPEFILCTIHREENTNDLASLTKIISALTKIHGEIPVVMPLHPRTRKQLKKGNIKCPLHIIDPVGYPDMLELIRHCRMVITDSGGLQKEAFFLSKFCITLRQETEWKELVSLGVNKVAGADEKKILSGFHSFMKQKFACEARPYGDGHAAEKIVGAIIKHF